MRVAFGADEGTPLSDEVAAALLAALLGTEAGAGEAANMAKLDRG